MTTPTPLASHYYLDGGSGFWRAKDYDPIDGRGGGGGPLSARIQVAYLRALSTDTSNPPPPGDWTPMQLNKGFIAPPTGASYVRYQDLYVAGDDLNGVLARVTGNRFLTLPEGLFQVHDFAMVNHAAIQIGTAGHTACKGIIGSGRGTIIEMAPHSTSQASRDLGNVTSGTNPLVTICLQGTLNGHGTENNTISGLKLGNFTLRGQDQDTLGWHGINVYNCADAEIYGIYGIAGSRGSGNAPPFETFTIATNNAPRCHVHDCELDGRAAAGREVAGLRDASSPIGWNNSMDALVERVYIHHYIAGMLTFWQTCNIETNDVWSFSTGTGSSNKSGSNCNHERAAGRIRHTRFRGAAWGQYNPSGVLPAYMRANMPPGDITATTANAGSHMTFQSDLHAPSWFPAQWQSDPHRDTIIIDPLWDTWNDGVAAFRCSDTYDTGTYGKSPTSVITYPRVVINGQDIEVRKRYSAVLDFGAGITGGNYTLTIAWTAAAFVDAKNGINEPAATYSRTTGPIAWNATNAQIAAAVGAVMPTPTTNQIPTQHNMFPVEVFDDMITPRRKELRFGTTGNKTVTRASSTLVGGNVTVGNFQTGLAMATHAVIGY